MPAVTDQPVSDRLLLAIKRATLMAFREGQTSMGLMLEATLNLGNDLNAPSREPTVHRQPSHGVTQVREVHAAMC